MLEASSRAVMAYQQSDLQAGMQQTSHVTGSGDIPCWTCVRNNHGHNSRRSKGTCMPCFQALRFVHQDQICSYIVAVDCGEGQSAQPAEAEEEAPEPQDGSLWWHGMFIRAGRMGNMASDVRPDGREQGKKVLHISVSIQSTTFLSLRFVRGVRRHLLGKHYTFDGHDLCSHLLIQFISQHICPLGSGTSSPGYLPALSQHSHANILIQLMCLLGISAGVCHSLPSLHHLIPAVSEWLAPCHFTLVFRSYSDGNLVISSGLCDL